MDRDSERDSLYEGMHDQDVSDEGGAFRNGDMVYMDDSEYGAREVDWGPPNSRYLREADPNPPYVVDQRKSYRCKFGIPIPTGRDGMIVSAGPSLVISGAKTGSKSQSSSTSIGRRLDFTRA